MSDLIDHFRRMALYNAKANETLYAACADLDEGPLKQRRPAFFGSIFATLNHIMLGDRIWLTRFEGGEAPSTGLDGILYDRFDALRAARVTEDARLSALVEGLHPDWLSGHIEYVNNQGRLLRDPNATLLAHLFNHQTHHRGQIHDMLSQTDVPPPSLDMHRLLNP